MCLYARRERTWLATRVPLWKTSIVKSYGPERIEAAARRGNDIRATTYGSIKSILQNGLDRAFAKPSTPDASPIRHANIRGRGYYH